RELIEADDVSLIRYPDAGPPVIEYTLPPKRRGKTTLDRYVKRLEQLEGIAKDMKGVREAFAIQAGREVRVIVDPARVDDTNCNFIARDIAKRVSEEMTFPGEIKVTVLREMRTVEFAK
ncbi:MAG: ribonuclease Y, partial [Phycisphaeraceae bacterium]